MNTEHSTPHHHKMFTVYRFWLWVSPHHFVSRRSPVVFVWCFLALVFRAISSSRPISTSRGKFVCIISLSIQIENLRIILSFAVAVPVLFLIFNFSSLRAARIMLPGIRKKNSELLYLFHSNNTWSEKIKMATPPFFQIYLGIYFFFNYEFSQFKIHQLIPAITIFFLVHRCKLFSFLFFNIQFNFFSSVKTLTICYFFNYCTY